MNGGEKMNGTTERKREKDGNVSGGGDLRMD